MSRRGFRPPPAREFGRMPRRALRRFPERKIHPALAFLLGQGEEAVDEVKDIHALVLKHRATYDSVVNTLAPMSKAVIETHGKEAAAVMDLAIIALAMDILLSATESGMRPAIVNWARLVYEASAAAKKKSRGT